MSSDGTMTAAGAGSFIPIHHAVNNVNGDVATQPNTARSLAGTMPSLLNSVGGLNTTTASSVGVGLGGGNVYFANAPYNTSTNPALAGLMNSSQPYSGGYVRTLGSGANAHNAVRPASEFYNAFMKNTFSEASRVVVGGVGGADSPYTTTATGRFRAAVARYRSSQQQALASAVGFPGGVSADGGGISGGGSNAGSAAPSTIAAGNTEIAGDDTLTVPADASAILGGLGGGSALMNEDVNSLMAPPPQFTTPQPQPETFSQFYLQKVATVSDEDNGVVVFPSVPFGDDVFTHQEYDGICSVVAGQYAKEIDAQQQQFDDDGASSDRSGAAFHPHIHHQLADSRYIASVTREFIKGTAIRDIMQQESYAQDDQKRRADSQFHMNFLTAGGPPLTVAHAGGTHCVYGEGGSGKSGKSSGGGGRDGGAGGIGYLGVERGLSAAINYGGGGPSGGVVGGGASTLTYSTHPFASSGGVHANPKHTFYGPRLPNARWASEGGDIAQFLSSLNRIGSCNVANINNFPALRPAGEGAGAGSSNTSTANGINVSCDDVQQQQQGTLVTGVPFRVYTACVIEKLNTAERTDTTSAATNNMASNAGNASEGLLNNMGSFNRPPSAHEASTFSDNGNLLGRPSTPLPTIADGASVDDFTGFALLHSRSMPPRFLPAGTNANNANNQPFIDSNGNDLGSQSDVYCTIVLYRPKRRGAGIDGANGCAAPLSAGNAQGNAFNSTITINNATGNIGGADDQFNDTTTLSDGSYASYTAAGGLQSQRNRASSFMSTSTAKKEGGGTSPQLSYMSHQNQQMQSNLLLCAAHRHHDSFAKRYRECCALDYECFVQETVVVPWATRNATLEYTNVIAQQSWDERGQPFMSIGGGLLFVKTMQNTNTVDQHEKRLAVVSRVGFVDVYKYVREVCITERRLAEANAASERADQQRQLLLQQQQQGDGSVGGPSDLSGGSLNLLSTTQMGGSGGNPLHVNSAYMASLANNVAALDRRAAELFGSIAVPRLFPQEVVFWRSPSDCDGTGTSSSTSNGSGNDVGHGSSGQSIAVAIDYVGSGAMMGGDSLNDSHQGGDTLSNSGASSSSGGIMMRDGVLDGGFKSAYGGGSVRSANSFNNNGVSLGSGSFASNLLSSNFLYVPVPAQAIFSYSSICIATCYSHYTEEQLLAEGYAMGERGGNKLGDHNGHSHPVDISYRCAGVMISVSSSNKVAVAKLTRRQHYYDKQDFIDSTSSLNVPTSIKGTPDGPLSPTSPDHHTHSLKGSYGGGGGRSHPAHHGGNRSNHHHHHHQHKAWDEEGLASTYPCQEVTMRISIPTTLPWNQKNIVQELIDFRIPIGGEEGAAGGVTAADGGAPIAACGTAGGASTIESLLSGGGASGSSNPNTAATPTAVTGTTDGDEDISCRIANSAGQQYIICFAQDLVESQWMGTLLHVQYAPFFLRHQHHTYLSYFAQRAHSAQPWRDDFRYALRNLPIRFFEGPNAHSTFDLDPKGTQQIQLQPIVQCVATFSIQKQVTKAYYCSRDRILILGAADGTAAVVGEGSSTWQTLFEPVKRRKAAMTDAEAAGAIAINAVASVRIPTASLKKRGRFGAKNTGNKTASHAAATHHEGRAGGDSPTPPSSFVQEGLRAGNHHTDPRAGDADGGASNESPVAPAVAVSGAAADADTILAFHKLLRTTFSIRGAFVEAVFEEIFSPLSMLMGGVSQPRSHQHLNLTHLTGPCTMTGVPPGGVNGFPPALSSGEGGAMLSARDVPYSTSGKGKKDTKDKKSDAKRESAAAVVPSPVVEATMPTSAEILSNRKDIQMMVAIIDVEPTIYHDVYMMTTPYGAALINVAIRKTQQTVSTLVIEEEEEVLSDDYEAYRPRTLENISTDMGGGHSNGTSQSNKGVVTLSHTTRTLPETRTVTLAYVLRVLSRKVGHYTNVGLSDKGRQGGGGGSTGLFSSLFRRGKKDGHSGATGAGTGVAPGSVVVQPVSGSGSTAVVSASSTAKKSGKVSAADAVAASANAAAVNAVYELMHSGGLAANLTHTRFNLVHVHLPAAMQDNGIIPPLAFLSAPIHFARHTQNKSGAVAGKVSSGSAVLLHTTIDPRRLDAAVSGGGILAALYNANGMGHGSGGNSVYGRAAARAKQILMGGGGGVGGAGSPRGGVMLLEGPGQQTSSLSNNSMFYSPTPSVSNGAPQPMSLMALPPSNMTAAGSGGAQDGCSSLLADPSLHSPIAPSVAPSSASPQGPSISSGSKASPVPQQRTTTLSVTSTRNNTTTTASTSSGGGVGKFFSKIFGSRYKGSAASKDASSKGASSPAGRPASVVSASLPSSGRDVGRSTIPAASTDDMTVAHMVTSGGGGDAGGSSGYRQSVSMDTPASQKSSGKEKGSGADKDGSSGAAGASQGGNYYNSSTTDVDIVTGIHSSHHWLPQREDVEDLRSNPSTGKTSHDDVGMDGHGRCASPMGPSNGPTRRRRRIERVAHTIETPVIVSLTSYKATNPHYYPDVRTFAVGSAAASGYNTTNGSVGGAGSTANLKFATSLSWGVAAYQHPGSIPLPGSSSTVAANGRPSSTTGGVASPSGYQYAFHPGNASPSSLTSPSPLVSPSEGGAAAELAGAAAPEYRVRPIIQPDLLERFDVYRLDCAPENTVTTLCDGYSHKVNTGEDVPVTVVALDARLHGVLCIMHMPGKANDHEVYCFRDEALHEGLSLFAENSMSM